MPTTLLTVGGPELLLPELLLAGRLHVYCVITLFIQLNLVDVNGCVIVSIVFFHGLLFIYPISFVRLLVKTIRKLVKKQKEQEN